ncbi:UNVERIFIED_CONTAM: hypothetical protein FKN15_038828 [Acipenser sinensis]
MDYCKGKTRVGMELQSPFYPGKIRTRTTFQCCCLLKEAFLLDELKRMCKSY